MSKVRTVRGINVRWMTDLMLKKNGMQREREKKMGVGGVGAKAARHRFK